MRFKSFAGMLGHYADRTPAAPALRHEENGAAAAEPPKKPEKLIFTDGTGTFTVRAPNVGG